MAYQKVFKRYELKYMLTMEQKQKVLEAMAPYMVPDKFGRSTIRNIYYDTDDYILARHSIAKPDYKEKLRVRSYSQVGHDDKVFVELKRKYDHLVYKRRVSLPESEAMAWMAGAADFSKQDSEKKRSAQMRNEIDYFLDYYKDLRPAMFISYDREAYRMKDPDDEFRVTFDENILCRDYDMSLTSGVYGTPILEKSKVLMELKCPGGIPLWMVKVLSAEKIYKTSFSKYGTAYTGIIMPVMAASYEKKLAASITAAESGADSRSVINAVNEGNTSGKTGRTRTKRKLSQIWEIRRVGV